MIVYTTLLAQLEKFEVVQQSYGKSGEFCPLIY